MDEARAQPVAGIAQAVEVHRLAVAGREADIARQVGRRVARVWLRTSRFADVDALTSATLHLGPDSRAFYDRGRARSATGRPHLALADYEQALSLYRDAGDRRNTAASLNNIGLGFSGLGDHQRALAHFEQALAILRDVGDRAGEATTLNNIGGIKFGQGDLDGALKTLHQVLDLVRAVGDRGTEAATNFNMAAVLARMARTRDAIDMQLRAISLAEATEHPDLPAMRAYLKELQDQKGH
ncbi:tetratricopeptide repeat protein [Dactylosporangium sp. CS-033363]|uniref:tetratricopeptide repeat protein n=1 Tax=Dactylosporangium sp. CS-033363 TaxID=3239935 RepID=UPI003D90A129